MVSRLFLMCFLDRRSVFATDSQSETTPATKARPAVPKNRTALAPLDPNSLSTSSIISSSRSESSGSTATAVKAPPKSAPKSRKKQPLPPQLVSASQPEPDASPCVTASGAAVPVPATSTQAAQSSDSSKSNIVPTKEPAIALIDVDKALCALAQFPVRVLSLISIDSQPRHFTHQSEISCFVIQCSAVIDVVVLRLQLLATLYATDNPGQVAVIHAIFRSFDRFRAFLLIMTSQLIHQFRTSATKKIAAFEDLRRNWSRIQQTADNYRKFVAVFTDDSMKFVGDQSLFAALCRTPIYAECMRSIYSVVECAVQQWSSSSAPSNSFAPVVFPKPKFANLQSDWVVQSFTSWYPTSSRLVTKKVLI